MSRRKRVGPDFVIFGITLISIASAAVVNGFDFPGARVAGLTALASTLSVSYLLLFGFFSCSVGIGKTEGRLMFLFILFFGVYIVSWSIESFKIAGIERLVQIALVAFVFFGVIFITRDQYIEGKWWFISSIFSILLLTNFVMWLGSGLPVPFEGLYGNQNALGQASFVSFGVIGLSLLSSNERMSKALWVLMMIVACILSLSTGSRGSIVATVIILLVFVVSPVISFSYVNRNIIFISILFVPFIILYMLIIGNPSVVNVINEIFTDIFGNTGSPLSGRAIIWSTIIQAAGHNPVLGLGASMVPSDLLDTGLSSHNIYLQIYLQSGFVGVSCFILILWNVWSILAKNTKNDKKIRWSLSFLLAAIFYDIFEATLIQNNLPFGVVKWIIIGFGIGVCLRGDDFNSIDS